jgi:4'-phosphopantetheinyl transferase
MAGEPAAPAGDEIHIWRTDIATNFAANPDAAAQAAATLPPADRERYGRYRADRDRWMFLAGRLMAREAVGAGLGVAPAAWQWRDGTHGRPEIASPATPLRFNLAHSGGLVVCALAHGRDVGVDVEDLARPSIDPRIVRRYCAPAEVEDIEAHGDAWRDRFLVYWTLKEAYLKARGLGISVPLEDICFTLAPDVRVALGPSLQDASTEWWFHLWRPTPRHVLAVAAEGTSGRVVEHLWAPGNVTS